MTSDASMVEIEKELFDEKCKRLRKPDIVWLLKFVVTKNPELRGYENDPSKEWKVYNRAGRLIYGVDRDNPADIRNYVERESKKEEYDNRLGELSNEVFSIKPGDAKACNDLERKIHRLLDEADGEFPGFTKARALMISEISGDLIAVKTKGSAGSTRMIRRMQEQKPEKKRQRT